MNILQYAMQMEKDGEEFYRDLAANVENAGIRSILAMLADEEARHYRVLADIEQGSAEVPETDLLNHAKNVFAEMKDTGRTFHLDEAQVDLYLEAQAIEQKSIDFYTEKAAVVPQDAQRQLLTRLAQEEKKHYFLLENIIDFVSRPTTWLENAEFCHLEQY